MNQNFRVDLKGVVDLLARHLYSSPRVYIRELLQNGVDAITARRAVEPACPDRLDIIVHDDRTLEVTDTGVGLTLDEASELLATIGRSSKRDLELGTGRDEYLGQFGIGLLSAFMVAEEIHMISRTARDPNAPAISWRGNADGSYTLEEIPVTEHPEPGSTVLLRPRRDLEHWLEADTVTELAKEFGSLLPFDVRVTVDVLDPMGNRTGGQLTQRISAPTPPWLQTFDSEQQRTEHLTNYCERTFAYRPLATIDLDIPLLQTNGVAFVLPAAVSPTGTSTHRVYLKRMLLGTRVPNLLPDWSFFVRCVIDSSTLRPTASREALYEDDVLLMVKESLGEQIKEWMRTVLSQDADHALDFISVHHLAVRAIALHDDTMLDLASEVLPFETTEGPKTLAEVYRDHQSVRYTATVEEYRRVATVARAQGLPVVNGGYVYDNGLLAKLAARKPDWLVTPLHATDVDHSLDLIPELEERRLARVVAELTEDLAEVDCEAILRSFSPHELPAMLIHDRDGDHQRDLARTVEADDDLWGEVLAGFATRTQPRRLALNFANTIVQQLIDTSGREARKAGVQALYVTALLLAQEPLRDHDATLMNASLTQLLRRALGNTDNV